VWACWALLASSALAQNVERAPNSGGAAQLVLEVHAARVERGALEQALRAELASEPAWGGRLELTDRPGDVVRLSYRDALGKESSRELRVAPDDPEAREKITLAAANLVRDQSDLAAALLPPVAPAAPPAAPPPPYDPCGVHPLLVFGADLVPTVGTSSSPAGRDAGRAISLNLLGSYSAGVRGFEASLGFNIDRRGACGFQGAVAFNLTLGPVRGTQLALVNLGASSVSGAQLGLANFARGRAGVQLGIANVALGGGSAQLGIANLARDEVGGQLGVANLAWGGVRRVQVGVAKIAGGDAKVQVGVVNVSRRAVAPVGIVSIVREGRTTVDAWATENGTLLAGVSHGGDYVHNIYGVGARVGPAGTRLVYTLGIGARLFSQRLLKLDFDMLGEQIVKLPLAGNGYVVRARLLASIALYRRLSLLLAGGYAVMDTDDPEERTQAPFGESELARYTSHTVYGFPSLSAGLRVALGGAR
jgi:hypothetical protein